MRRVALWAPGAAWRGVLVLGPLVEVVQVRLPLEEGFVVEIQCAVGFADKAGAESLAGQNLGHLARGDAAAKDARQFVDARLELVRPGPNPGPDYFFDLEVFCALARHAQNLRNLRRDLRNDFLLTVLPIRS